MRAFAACLTVVLGLGAFSVVACSSDATTTATGGAGGEAGAVSSPAAGAGGKAASSAGAPGAAGEAGAPACTFSTPTCQGCLGEKCLSEASACTGDTAMCDPQLGPLEVCACDPTKTIAECIAAFKTAGGSAAADLVTCFNANCTAACE